MARVIIEVLNLLGHVVERHKFDVFPVKIGRGYDNDLIISDLHVSAHHAQLHEELGGWRVEDLASNNGTQVKTHGHQSSRDHIQTGDDIIVGKTRLRCYSPQHAVPPTHAFPVSEAITRYIGHTRAWIALLIACLALLTLNQQLEVSKPVPLEKLLVTALSPLFIALCWASVWAFAGRVIKHRASFGAHFSASLLFLLAIMLIDVVVDYVGYNTSGEGFTTVLEFILVGSVISGLLFVNLAYSTHAPRRRRIFTSHAAGWSLVLLLFFLQFAGQPEHRSSPTFPSTLKPPFAKLVASQPINDFLQESEKVFATPDTQ